MKRSASSQPFSNPLNGDPEGLVPPLPPTTYVNAGPSPVTIIDMSTQAQVNSNHMDMRRGNPRSFSIYSGTLSQKKTELAASLCTTTEEESQRVDVSPQPVLKHATEFKTLEENIQEELRIAGLHWIGRRVEYFWAYPLEQRGFYSGVIIDYKKLDKDTQYLIQYDKGNRCEWEVVDSGFRFIDRQFQPEAAQVLELRRCRADFFVLDTAERISYRLFFPEKDKHTMVGPEYQVDLIHALSQLDISPIGERVWVPTAISPGEVARYLEMTSAQLEPVNELYGKPKELSFIEDHSTTTIQTTLDILHNNNYNIDVSDREMKREGVFWCAQKPSLKAHWTSVEVAMFELEMKMTPKKFRLIYKSMIEKAMTGKTLYDIIHFYWYWKSTTSYKQWKRKDRISIEGVANFRLDHAISLKQSEDGSEISRNPRLRKRPRVDYSYSNLPMVRESPVKTPEKKRRGKGGHKSQPLRASYDLTHLIAYPDLPVLDITIFVAQIDPETIESSNQTRTR